MRDAFTESILEGLTMAERRMLSMVAQGKTGKEIALECSEYDGVPRNHLYRARMATDSKNTIDLLMKVICEIVEVDRSELVCHIAGSNRRVWRKRYLEKCNG